jgi:hypothetical protein
MSWEAHDTVGTEIKKVCALVVFISEIENPQGMWVPFLVDVSCWLKWRGCGYGFWASLCLLLKFDNEDGHCNM